MTRYEKYLEKKMKENSYNGMSIAPRKGLQVSKHLQELIERYNKNELTDEELDRYFNKFYMAD